MTGSGNEPMLVDRFGIPVRTLRLSITDRCNHRCLYCMPPEGIRLVPRQDIMSIEEAVALTGILAQAGIRRVRVTGGEPMVREALIDLVSRLHGIAAIEDLAMTTNAVLLKTRAEPLRKAGLKRINISLDTLDPHRFYQLTRRNTHAAVIDGIHAASSAGFDKIHLNTVAVRGFNHDELWDICNFAWNLRLVPRFIELMPTGPSGFWSYDKFMPAQDVVALLEEAAGSPAFALEQAGGFGPAGYFEFPTGNRFGVIASVTGHICANCDRVRVRATGELQTCLMRPAGPNLLEILRTAGPAAVIRETQRACKGKTHRPEETNGPPTAMSCVGG